MIIALIFLNRTGDGEVYFLSKCSSVVVFVCFWFVYRPVRLHKCEQVEARLFARCVSTYKYCHLRDTFFVVVQLYDVCTWWCINVETW